MMELPKVYDTATDSVVDVTQKWCDDAGNAINLLARQRDIVRAVAALNIVKDAEKIEQIGRIVL